MPPIAANAIATPTITHGARLIKRANLSKITSLNPTNSEASPRVRGGPVVFFIFLPGLQVLSQPPKPIRTPVVERDPELHDLVMHAMRLRRSHRFVLSKPGRDLLVAPAHRLEMRERLLARHRVGEEELEQHLVADLQVLDLRVGHPRVQRLLALRREVVEGALPGALRCVLGLDQPRLREALQLGVDLPVAGRPEVAGGQVRELLDVVARVRAQPKNAEDDVGGRAELHIAYRYIIKIYLPSISGAATGCPPTRPCPLRGHGRPPHMVGGEKLGRPTLPVGT